ncbi:MAG: malonyl-CoA synthase [Thiolinea sp.]
MYEQNYLAGHLRSGSAGRENSRFARLYDNGSEISFAEFFHEAERIAAVLQEAGVGPGDRVAVQAEKSITALALYVGTILAGAVFLPLNTAYTPAEIAYFLNDATPAVFVCDPQRLETLAPIAEKAGIAQILTLDADGQGTLTDRQPAQSSFTAVPRDADDLAAILYTSGTTGRSKGAMLTHRNLASNAEVLRDYWQFTADDVLIHALPIFHVHGLFVAVNTLLIAGASMIFMRGFDAQNIISSMPNATVLMGVPTFYVRLLGQNKLADAARSMRLFVSGSAPLLAATHQQWQSVTGHAILERYGMTETGMNTSNPYSGERRAGTVGFPLPGTEVIITDPQTGEWLPQGETGSIEIRGPNVFKGYWQMPEKTAEELRDNGFFISGDLGFYDGAGYLNIVGRCKDLIITGGYNVYPKEVELLIDELPGVNESAVIGVPHPDFGEAVVAVVVPRSETELMAEDIISALGGVLARYKQPKQVFIVDALPRNTMGKVQKNVLREQFSTVNRPPA